jgi:hypothetical protein
MVFVSQIPCSLMVIEKAINLLKRRIDRREIQSNIINLAEIRKFLKINDIDYGIQSAEKKNHHIET